MDINVVGGGPAGLYFAILMKKRDPRHRIVIHERDAADDTFGWGIVFSDQTLSFLRENDAESCGEIMRRFVTWENVDVVHRDDKISILGNKFAGIGRLAFLNVLQKRCADLGVEIRYRENVGEGDLARLSDCDLFVGSDGANSLVRRSRAARFEPKVEAGKNKYIWLGTRRLFHGLTLTFRSGAAGPFAAHSYKFNADTSTFIVECSEATWARAGFAAMSGEATCAALEKVFERDLEGHPLLTNNFVKWLHFPLVRNGRWSDGNTVLLGDALHTAHFSIGSGTKLAVEDSIALAKAFDAKGAVPAALAEFERTRRPVVEALQEAAASSLAWFESFGEKMGMEPMALAYDIMTRSGRIDIEKLRGRDPAFAARYERWRAAR